MTDIRAEAQAEAERRYPNDPVYEPYGRLAPEVRSMRDAFEDGVEWRDAQVEALLDRIAMAVESMDDERVERERLGEDSDLTTLLRTFALSIVLEIEHFRAGRTLQEEGGSE